MKKEKKSGEGQLPGVFIAARKIENEGVISSEGPGARTEIITEDYSGPGVIKSKNTDPISKRKWYEKWWGILILGVIASAVVAIMVYLLS